VLGAYRPLFATGEARRLVAASAVARLSTGLAGLPMLLVAVDATGSYAVAGVVDGAFGAGIAASAPWRGRLIDRRGSRRALPPLVLAHAAGLAALPLVAVTRSAALLILVAFLAGASAPAFPAAMRLEWQRILGAGDPRLAQAYTFETVTQILAFVAGPLLAGACVATVGARAGLVLAGALALVGGLTLAALAQARPAGPPETPRRRGGPIRHPAVRMPVIATLLADAGLGVVEVAVIAFAQQRGQPAVAGVLLAAFCASSALGGALYGARTWANAPRRRLVAIVSVAAVAMAPLAAADSFAALAVLLVLAGPPFAAQWATISLAVDAVAPAGSAAEAFNWLSTANAIGVSAGSVLAGAAIERSGTGAAFLIGACVVATAAAVLAARRRAFAAA
jgi:predicted MFS family arabinose efflux permease